MNQGHADFQSAALPTELFGHFRCMTALETILNRNQLGSKEGVFNRLGASESSALAHFGRLFCLQNGTYRCRQRQLRDIGAPLVSPLLGNRSCCRGHLHLAGGDIKVKVAESMAKNR